MRMFLLLSPSISMPRHPARPALAPLSVIERWMEKRHLDTIQAADLFIHVHIHVYSLISFLEHFTATSHPSTSPIHTTILPLLLIPTTQNERKSPPPPPRLNETPAHTSSFPQIVEWAFGKRMTPQERLRKHQRALEKTQRELDRERVKLENQEKKLVQDIKKSAKNGQMGACKIQAKDLVRTRRWVLRSFPVSFHFEGSLRLGCLFWAGGGLHDGGRMGWN